MDKPTKPKIKEGVPQPNSINETAIQKLMKKKRALPSLEQFLTGIQQGDRAVLSKAITLIESKRPDHQLLGEKLVDLCLPQTGNSIRIGITGTPGVGKSTFIEAFGKLLLEAGKKVAVLAVDPSSQVSGGSILGDKTRMEELSSDSRAFIRPSAAGDSLGGVARKTRETIMLLEAAGYDTILVETVGVGQSETAVHSMVDFFLLLLLPGGGDELQGIKRGIVEMADLIVVNKADGANVDLANRSRQAYKNALHLFPPKENSWIPKARTCSAISGEGLAEIWTTITGYQEQMKETETWELNRQEQSKYWLHQTIKESLGRLFYQQENIKQQIRLLEKEVVAGRYSSFKAARELIALFGK